MTLEQIMKAPRAPLCRIGACALALLCSSFCMLALAQQPRALEPLPDVPPPPRPSAAPPTSSSSNEPQVTIRQENGNRVEEFRMRGRLYAVRITPPVGRPYIMVDRTGKGTMSRMDDVTGGGISPPQWTLFEF